MPACEAAGAPFVTALSAGSGPYPLGGALFTCWSLTAACAAACKSFCRGESYSLGGDGPCDGWWP